MPCSVLTDHECHSLSKGTNYVMSIWHGNAHYVCVEMDLEKYQITVFDGLNKHISNWKVSINTCFKTVLNISNITLDCILVVSCSLPFEVLSIVTIGMQCKVGHIYNIQFNVLYRQ